MTKEVLQEMKDDHIDYLKKMICELGSLSPIITVFAEVEGEKKPAVIHIPIPPEYMESSDSKDTFVYEMIPQIFSEIKQKFTPVGVVWAVEAWVRRFDKEFNSNDNSKKEVIFISMQDKDGYDSKVYNIIRKGKQVNFDGDLVDIVELEQDKELSGMNDVDGRFSNLFSKFDD